MRAVGANREVIATDALTVARLADAVLSQRQGQEDHRTVLGITVLIPIGAGNADCYTAARPAVTAPSGSGRVVGREEITSSTIRYSFACSAVMKKSRSVSRWIFSMGLAGVVGQDAVQLLAHPEDLLGLDVDVGGLPLHAAQRLVEHDPRMGQGEPACPWHRLPAAARPGRPPAPCRSWRWR